MPKRFKIKHIWNFQCFLIFSVELPGYEAKILSTFFLGICFESYSIEKSQFIIHYQRQQNFETKPEVKPSQVTPDMLRCAKIAVVNTAPKLQIIVKIRGPTMISILFVI